MGEPDARGDGAGSDDAVRCCIASCPPVFVLAGHGGHLAAVSPAGATDVIHVHWPLAAGAVRLGGRKRGPAPRAWVTTFYGVELRWVKGTLPFLKGFSRVGPRDARTAWSAISNYNRGRAARARRRAHRGHSLHGVASRGLRRDPPPARGRRWSRCSSWAGLVGAQGRPPAFDRGNRAPGAHGAPPLEIVGEGPERPTLESTGRSGSASPQRVVVFEGKSRRTSCRRATRGAGRVCAAVGARRPRRQRRAWASCCSRR